MNIICNTKYKIGYAPIAKCGSQTFCDFIWNLRTRDLLYTELVHDQQLELSDYVTQDPDDPKLIDYFTFSFSRNPYTRLISAYNQILKNKNWYHIFPNEIPTFRGFVERLKDKGINDDVHTESQLFHLGYHPEKLAFIGKLENLNHDINHIARSCNINEYNLKHWQQSIPDGDPETAYGLKLMSTPEMAISSAVIRRMIYELYKDDFEAFGYAYNSIT